MTQAAASLRLPRAAEQSWVRRHADRLRLATDLACGLVFVVGTFLFAGEVVEDTGSLVRPGFVVLCLGAGLWGAVRGAVAMLTDEPEDEGGRRVERASSGPPMWARLGLLLLVTAGAALLGGVLLPDEPDAMTGLLEGGGFAALMGVISVLCGFAAWLMLVVLGLVGFGLWLFGGVVVVRGRAPDGTEAPRRSGIAPFLACLGLVGLPLTLAGTASYDSPYRRDVLPLLGILRDGVEVTHPVLLHAAQVSTWLMAGALVVATLLRVLLEDPPRD